MKRNWNVKRNTEYRVGFDSQIATSEGYIPTKLYLDAGSEANAVRTANIMRSNYTGVVVERRETETLVGDWTSV